MPVIRISEQSMERLRKWAEPLTDTADVALAKALDAAKRNLSPSVDMITAEPDRRRTASFVDHLLAMPQVGDDADFEPAGDLEPPNHSEQTMRGRYSQWDAAKYIRNEEEARLYLEACAEEDPGDGSLIRVALSDIARARNMSSLARRVGMTRQGLYKALSTEGNPSFTTVMRITRALGMDLRITIGVDPSDEEQAVTPAPSPHPAR